MTKYHYNNVTKMLSYTKSYTNNLTQQENKYGTGEDNCIYFLEAIIKKTKKQTNKNQKRKKNSSPCLKSTSPL